MVAKQLSIFLEIFLIILKCTLKYFIINMLQER